MNGLVGWFEMCTLTDFLTRCLRLPDKPGEGVVGIGFETGPRYQSIEKTTQIGSDDKEKHFYGVRFSSMRCAFGRKCGRYLVRDYGESNSAD